MAHVTKEQLHQLFFSLERHHSGEARVPGMELDEELTGILERTARDDKRVRKQPQRLLSVEAIAKLMQHTSGCQQCQILVYEEGPYAERPKTEEELAQEKEVGDEEERKLTIRFWLSALLGVASFVGAQVAIVYARDFNREPANPAGPTLRGVNDFQLNPMHLLFGMLILVAAFSIAEAWRVANLIWLDWSKAKEAVPVIGKAWAARSRRKKAESESAGQ